MDFLRSLLEDADNYLPDPMMAYGFSMQELAIIRSAKGDDEKMQEFVKDNTYRSLRKKTCRFLQRHGKLENAEDEEQLCSVLRDDPRF